MSLFNKNDVLLRAADKSKQRDIFSKFHNKISSFLDNFSMKFSTKFNCLGKNLQFRNQMAANGFNYEPCANQATESPTSRVSLQNLKRIISFKSTYQKMRGLDDISQARRI